jgi:hypothetical protein
VHTTGLRLSIVASFLFPTLLWCQNPVRVCVAVIGNDVLVDTRTRLAEALTQHPSRKGTSLFGTALRSGDKLNVMAEARQERCEYLINLRWLSPESVDLRTFQSGSRIGRRTYKSIGKFTFV